MKKKIWIGEDHNELGAWSLSTPDATILAELLSQCGDETSREVILAGSIVICEWNERLRRHSR